MTDSEYAVRIYCRVFNKTTDNGDAYVRGILDAIDMLELQEQVALECYYRYGQSLAMTGVASQYSTKSAVDKAFRKLRHPSRYRDMSVSAMLARRQKLLDEANAKIEKLYESLELLISRASIDPVVQAELDARKQGIHDLGLSQRTKNHLICVGINTVDDLLALESLDKLMIRRGFGEKSRDELLAKMREQGYDEWADRIKV